MGGNGEPLAHSRIWSGPLKLLLPVLGVSNNSNPIDSLGEPLLILEGEKGDIKILRRMPNTR